MKKRCLRCQKKFKVKRSDQLFCSTTCRVYYHRFIRNSKLTTKNDIILSLCDYSSNWSQPYADAGYKVHRIDIQHGQDVRLLKHQGKVHGILAAPPCTHFASSGAASWRKKGESTLLEGLSVFDACARLVLFCDPEWWVFENPVGRLKHYIGDPQWIFDPCDYGDPYTKKTCLWGKFNIPKPDRIELPETKRGHHSIDRYWKEREYKLGKDRQMLRSTTPPGFAKAFFEVNP